MPPNDDYDKTEMSCLLLFEIAWCSNSSATTSMCIQPCFWL